MNIKFESKFEKDLRMIKDKQLLSKIKEIILDCKQADNIGALKHIKKLRGHDTFYRIKTGEYRIGFELLGDELIFTNFCIEKTFTDTSHQKYD